MSTICRHSPVIPKVQSRHAFPPKRPCSISCKTRFWLSSIDGIRKFRHRSVDKPPCITATIANSKPVNACGTNAFGILISTIASSSKFHKATRAFSSKFFKRTSAELSSAAGSEKTARQSGSKAVLCASPKCYAFHTQRRMHLSALVASPTNRFAAALTHV